MALSTNAIKEANEQISLMHTKMQGMQKEIDKLHQLLSSKKEEEMKFDMQQIVNKKDVEIGELKTQLAESNDKITRLEQEIVDFEVKMEKLQSKSKILDEVVGFQGQLERLLSYLKIVKEMNVNQNDINDNIRETEITDSYLSDDEQVMKTDVILNQINGDSNTGTVHLENV